MENFTILASLQSKLDDKIQKINKKMLKYNDNQVFCECSAPRFDEDPDSRFYKHFVIDVTVEGSYKIDNWEFVAVCDYHAEIGKNIIRKTPGSDLVVPSIYYTSNNCDHCGSNRNRKKTILLYNRNTQEWKQVGTACVKDYIGVNVEDYLFYLRSIDDLEQLQHETASRHEEEYFLVTDILEQTCARIRRTGYISQNKAREAADRDEFINTTASDVFHIMNHSRDFDGNIILPEYEITSEIEEQAAAVVDFVRTVECNDDEYITNLKNFVELKYVTNKDLGLVVSMVGYYLRQQAKNETVKIPSEYIGEVGAVIEFEATPECVYSFDTQFGTSYIYRFNVNNNIVIWKTGNFLNVDESYKLKGRVKSHNEYHGIKQTEVTRCRVVA